MGAVRNDRHTRPRRPTRSPLAAFALGRARFAQISAVDGIVLTEEMHATFDRFDRKA